MKRRQKHISEIYSLAAKALARGARREGHTLIVWDISGSCQEPYPTINWARPPAEPFNKRVVIKPGTAIPMEVRILTRCHKCRACLKHRASLWTARGIQETKAAARTWFSTLTLSPDHAHLALTRARVKEGSQGIDFDTLGPPEQFRLWVAQVSPEITKFLKRVRDKHNYAPLRYLLIAEAHKSGVPHFHALIHEPDPALPVRHKTLSESWKLGFSKFRLVRPDYTLEEEGRIIRPAHYVASYLAKDQRARVRASLYYGKATSVGLSRIEDREREYIDPEKTLKF